MLKVRPHLMVDLHQLHRHSAYLHERHDYPAARAVRLDDDPVPVEGRRQVVNLERHMRHCLDQFRIRRVVRVPLPLNAGGRTRNQARVIVLEKRVIANQAGFVRPCRSRQYTIEVTVTL